MNTDREKYIREQFEKLLEMTLALESDDIMGLGKCLNFISFLRGELQNESHHDISILSEIKTVLERIVLGEMTDMAPAVDCAERLCGIRDNGESALNPMISGSHYILENCNDDFSENDEYEENHQDKTEEDVQILCDFIVESSEGLEALEFALVDLEKNPENPDTLNSIFRIFHTIKGVSGFLELKKINSLAHTTENLLDEVRQGTYPAGRKVIDIIFESVDTMKRLIHDRKVNVESGFPWRESDKDIKGLQARIAAIPDAHKEIPDISNEDLPDEDLTDMPIGEILVHRGIVKKEDVESGLGFQKEHPEKKLGEILVEQKKADSKDICNVLNEQKNARSHAGAQVKIDITKLDNLVDLTGELVIAQSMLKQYSQNFISADPRFYQFINQLSHAVSGIQKTAMSMRMVPIRSTFQKMVRLIRDLSKTSGKDIVLGMSGEDTEIDRNMVEALYEPMVHMIRNSADHGLETAEERLSAGKSPSGTVFLRAYHKGGNIVIEIEDDGRGLNKSKIIEKALSINLIHSAENMTDEQIYNLVFEPGFSTASEITDISGRGVGMDVVKQSIESMKGHIKIDSVPGRGCTFYIGLPLTLAIIEGMVVRAGTETYIIPTMSILESFRPARNEYQTVRNRGEMIMVRGHLLQLVRTDGIFGGKLDTENPWEGIVIVLENKNEKLGLMVDEVLGKDEFVIKTLGTTFRQVVGIAGGSIMADGRVSLIIDVPGLFDRALS